jgi:hypothetical protein
MVIIKDKKKFERTKKTNKIDIDEKPLKNNRTNIKQILKITYL